MIHLNILLGLRYPSHAPERQRAYYAANKPRFKEYGKRAYAKNKEKILARGRDWVKRNPDRNRKIKREWARLNPESSNGWAKRNPEARRQSARKYARKVLATPKGRLDHRMSIAVLLALKEKKNGRKWEDLVGYSLSELHSHLEKSFLPGMNWERFLKGQIQIDHRIPKRKFSYTDSSDPGFRQCWALENLRPMWARANLSKGAKILSPTQVPLGL